MGATSAQHGKKAANDMTGQEMVLALGLPTEAMRLLPLFVFPIVKQNGPALHEYYRPEQFTEGVLHQLRSATELLITQRVEHRSVVLPIRGYWGRDGYRSASSAKIYFGRWVLEIDGVAVNGKGRRFRLDSEDGRVLDIHDIQRGG